jgi:hypothetical protein
MDLGEHFIQPARSHTSDDQDKDGNDEDESEKEAGVIQ